MTPDEALALKFRCEQAEADAKRAWEEAAQARVDGAVNILEACEAMNAENNDLEAALAALRQRHATEVEKLQARRQAWEDRALSAELSKAAAVEQAYREGWYAYDEECGALVPDEAGCEAAWLASEAKAELEGER